MEVFWKPKKYTAQSVHGHISQIKYERSLTIGLRENNGTQKIDEVQSSEKLLLKDTKNAVEEQLIGCQPNQVTPF